MAAMPLDDAVPPDRAFEKAARKVAKQFAKSSKNADANETDRLATEALNAIKALATEHGENYYATRYDIALSA
jgi:predicted DNA binding CopG/RHH family protein